MKYFKTLLVSILSLTILASSPLVLAQTRSTDSESIQQRLEEEGLDEAPEVIEVEESTMSGVEPSSGFVDENGDPLSDEEYAAWREDNEKGFLKKNPWVMPVALALIAGGVFVALKRKK